MIRQGILAFEPVSTTSRRVAGLSLLERGIRTMARAGIEQILVIVPAGGSPTLSQITRNLEISIEFVTWGTTPPPSFVPQGGFLLLLGDYVHHYSSLQALLERDPDGRDLVVHAAPSPREDRPLYEVSASSTSVDFAELERADGRACSGAFLCTSGLFTPAELTSAETDLWTFLQARAAGRQIAVQEAPLPLWRRVGDRRSARAAKNMLFSQVTKSTSGFVSRYINARISIPTSKFLVETGITPHMVTVLLVLTTGLSAAYLVTQATDAFKLALAGILWQFAAIFDRCDGEIARIKLCESKFGEWFDTVTDNIAYICAYIGVIIGIHRLHPDTMLYVYLGISAITTLVLILIVMYSYAVKTGSGSLQNYLVGFASVPDSEKSLVYKFMERYAFIAKRDFFSFFIFLTAIFNCLEIAYWFVIAGLHLLVVGVLISQNKMVHRHRSAHLAEPQAAVPLLDSVSSPAPTFGDGGGLEERQ